MKQKTIKTSTLKQIKTSTLKQYLKINIKNPNQRVQMYKMKHRPKQVPENKKYLKTTIRYPYHKKRK